MAGEYGRMEWITELTAEWKGQVELFRRYGNDDQARMLESIIEQLEAAAKAAATRTVTIDEAAAATGFCRRTIERHLAEGRLTNLGTPGAPRILAYELPRKGRTASAPVVAEVTATHFQKKPRRSAQSRARTDGGLPSVERIPLQPAA